MLQLRFHIPYRRRGRRRNIPFPVGISSMTIRGGNIHRGPSNASSAYSGSVRCGGAAAVLCESVGSYYRGDCGFFVLVYVAKELLKTNTSRTRATAGGRRRTWWTEDRDWPAKSPVWAGTPNHRSAITGHPRAYLFAFARPFVRTTDFQSVLNRKTLV